MPSLVRIRRGSIANHRTMRVIFSSILLMLGSNAASASDPWVEQFRYGPYIVRSEFKVSTDRAFLVELSDLEREVVDTLKLKQQPVPIELNLFASRNSYLNFIWRRVPEGRRRRALFVKGDDHGRVYAYRSREFTTDIRHECTHALLHNALPFLPIWMDEGLAEYFEATPAARRASDRLKNRKRWSRVGWSPNLKHLERNHGLRDMNATDYVNSWSWIRFMLHESDESRKVVVTYIQEIQNGDPPGAFSAYLDQHLPNANQRLLNYFRKWSLD